MLAALALLAMSLHPAAGAAASARWLFVSDIHFDPTGTHANGKAGQDTNRALLASAIAAMQRVEPAPPVVLIDGDFLGHILDDRFAIKTMQDVAVQFNTAFPNAQFLLVLGNEDSNCGDYGLAPNGAFLRSVAHAWEPLVNRHHAAPAFLRTFVRDGFYVSRLPVARLRAVIVDDVIWSPRYHRCTGTVDPPDELPAALASNRGGAWVVAHIPPGIDAYSTVHLARNLLTVPFLRRHFNDRFINDVADSRHDVRLLVTGHTHKFGFRLVSGQRNVPILSIPSVSPIFRNAPSFLTVSVNSYGLPQSIDEWSRLNGRWIKVGDLSTLHMDGVSASSVSTLFTHLAGDRALRDAYARMYSGGAAPEIDDRNWHVYGCSATALTVPAFRACTAAGGFSFLTRKGLVVGSIALAVAIAGGVFLLNARRGRAR